VCRPGAIGAFGANHHLRQSFVFLNIPMMPQPEAYVGGAATLFDKEGSVTNESTQKFLKTFMPSPGGPRLSWPIELLRVPLLS
jgi:chromate reductase